MSSILDRVLARLPNHDYDHDCDGRPPVGWPDPLLDALVCAHPDRIPAELIDQLATSRGRVTF